MVSSFQNRKFEKKKYVMHFGEEEIKVLLLNCFANQR